MQFSTEGLYGALYKIGSEDGTADKIAPTVQCGGAVDYDDWRNWSLNP